MKYQLDDVWIDKLKNTSFSLEEKRRIYRIVMVIAIAFCYSFDSVFLYLYYKIGTIDFIVFLTFTSLAIFHLLFFSYLHWFGISEKFKNPHMTRWQLSYAVLIQIICIILQPSLTMYFMALIFIIFSFAIIRINIIEALVMWVITTIIISLTLYYFDINNILIINPTREEKLLIIISYSAILFRIILLGYYNALIKQKLFTMNAKLEKETRYDDLTQIYNRKSILDYYNDFKNICKRSNNSFCVIMIDLDKFKDVNDKYGHLQGDVVLFETARIIKESCRDIDKIGRYGGEEFLLLLSSQTKEEAFKVIERVRENLEKKTWGKYVDLKVTISCGLYFVTKDNLNNELIKNADLALYKAKKSGRNKTICF